MKVTVAFGDIKVVVPCGHGEITIRQLSELAITRYLKSIQQEKKSQRMFVNINALVLARDFGILDWDDNVSDVCDDRELIIARFQISETSFNITSANSVTSNVEMTSTNANHFHFCSEWGNCLPFDSTVTSATGKSISYSKSTPPKLSTVTLDSNESSIRVNSRRNGSLVPISTNSIDSYTYDWKIPISNSCRNSSNERRHYPKGKSLANKRLSVDEIDSSLWPVPPPLLEAMSTTNKSEISTHSITPVLTKSLQPNPLSLTYFSYPYSQSLSTDSDVTKKSPLMNISQFGARGSSDVVQAPSSLSSSLPSNADAKSMPQSYYSSLESTAVSDGNNSSYDDCQHDLVIAPPLSIKVNQLEYKDLEGRFFFPKKTQDSVDKSNNFERIKESEISNESLPGTVECVLVSGNCDLSDIQEEELSTRSKPIHNHDTFRPNSLVDSSSNSNRLIISSNLQLPPPMPPLRSAFTKLSPKPLNIAFQTLNFNTVSSSDCHLDNESASDIKNKSNYELIENQQQMTKSKSEHSIPSLFDSEIHLVEDVENEWSTSERSADLESMATTTETSVHTTTTATTSFNTSSRNSDGLVVTLTKSSNGFGFSLTSRQNAVDLTNPVYVSKVLENGPAIFDGRMKAGDRILMINDEDVRHLSQKNIKEILLNIPVESTVKIGLCRPNSDAISNILGASNTSTIQKKNLISTTLNHIGDEVNDECNQISVEEQKPVSFPMCTCAHKQSLPCSKLNLYHFIIPLKAAKSDYLSPQFIDRSTSDLLSKSLDIKIEPPAIQLHHQNKLSSCSFSNKQIPNTKAPNATLGISVRRGISQMSFNDPETGCHNTCRSQPSMECSVKNVNSDSAEKFRTNNYSNFEESAHKFCPNCHGLLFIKHGVFVKAIISGGAAHMDGRLVTGDEIIAVQGVCLYNGEEFLPPNNKVFLGDSYESLKFAQMPSHFQNRLHSINPSSSNIDSTNKPDPLNLLKQILNYAQCNSNSVSLIIIRRSLEKRSCSINTLASVDANYCHNVTVEADVHTQYKREDNRADLFNFGKSHLICSNDPSTRPSSNREKIERLDDRHIKDHRQRFYRKDSDNSQEHNTSTNLICLESEHESDDQCPANSDNISNPNNSPNNNVSLAESYHVSSGILTDFEKKCVPIAFKNKNKDGSVIASVDSLVNSNNSFLFSSTSCLTPTEDNSGINYFLGADLQQSSYFSREDNSRQSFSLKRVHLNPLASFRISNMPQFNKPETSLIKSNTKQYNILKRPKSEMFLSRVEEENSSSENSERSNFEEFTQTIDRKVTLKRRSANLHIERDKALYQRFINFALKSVPSQED